MRLLSRGEWFDRLGGPGAMSEAAFEQLILENARHLFPGHRMVPYRLDVVSDDDTRRPDFALIRDDYKSWWVVEVELIHHSLQKHVIPQVACFSAGQYSPSLGAWLARSSRHLSASMLTEMIKGAPPKVLVIANAFDPEWERNLTPYGAIFCAIQVFRSDKNHYIFEFEGPSLEAESDVLTVCRRDRALPRLLIVDSPASLLRLPRDRLTIYVDDVPTDWARLNSKDRVWLNPVHGDPLEGSRVVEMVEEADGRLRFRVPSKGGGET